MQLESGGHHSLLQLDQGRNLGVTKRLMRQAWTVRQGHSTAQMQSGRCCAPGASAVVAPAQSCPSTLPEPSVSRSFTPKMSCFLDCGRSTVDASLAHESVSSRSAPGRQKMGPAQMSATSHLSHCPSMQQEPAACWEVWPVAESCTPSQSRHDRRSCDCQHNRSTSSALPG